MLNFYAHFYKNSQICEALNYITAQTFYLKQVVPNELLLPIIQQLQSNSTVKRESAINCLKKFFEIKGHNITALIDLKLFSKFVSEAVRKTGTDDGLLYEIVEQCCYQNGKFEVYLRDNFVYIDSNIEQLVYQV